MLKALPRLWKLRARITPPLSQVPEPLNSKSSQTVHFAAASCLTCIVAVWFGEESPSEGLRDVVRRQPLDVVYLEGQYTNEQNLLYERRSQVSDEERCRASLEKWFGGGTLRGIGAWSFSTEIFRKSIPAAPPIRLHHPHEADTPHACSGMTSIACSPVLRIPRAGGGRPWSAIHFAAASMLLVR